MLQHHVSLIGSEKIQKSVSKDHHPKTILFLCFFFALRHFLQLFQTYSQVLPLAKRRNIFSPACPGSTSGPPQGHAWDTSPKQVSIWNRSPQLTPLDAKERWLYSELRLDDWPSHPISKGASRHPVEEAHCGRIDWLVNWVPRRSLKLFL